MVDEKNDFYYIEKIIKDLQIIVENTRGMHRIDFQIDSILCDSILFRIIQISENTSKISDVFKEQHFNIPWKAIKGMRNRIVHEYGDVDLEVIYVTVTNDVPALLEELKIIFPQ